MPCVREDLNAVAMREERLRAARRRKVELWARKRAMDMFASCAPCILVEMAIVAVFADSVAPIGAVDVVVLSLTTFVAATIPALLEYRRALLEAL